MTIKLVAFDLGSKFLPTYVNVDGQDQSVTIIQDDVDPETFQPTGKKVVIVLPVEDLTTFMNIIMASIDASGNLKSYGEHPSVQ